MAGVERRVTDVPHAVLTAQPPIELRFRLAGEFDKMAKDAGRRPELAGRLPFACLLPQVTADNISRIAALFSSSVVTETVGIEHNDTIHAPTIERTITFKRIDVGDSEGPIRVEVANSDEKRAQTDFISIYAHDERSVAAVLGTESFTVVRRDDMHKDSYEVLTVSPTGMHYIEHETEDVLLTDDTTNQSVAKAISLLEEPRTEHR